MHVERVAAYRNAWLQFAPLGMEFAEFVFQCEEREAISAGENEGRDPQRKA